MTINKVLIQGFEKLVYLEKTENSSIGENELLHGEWRLVVTINVLGKEEVYRSQPEDFDRKHRVEVKELNAAWYIISASLIDFLFVTFSFDKPILFQKSELSPTLRINGFQLHQREGFEPFLCAVDPIVSLFHDESSDNREVLVYPDASKSGVVSEVKLKYAVHPTYGNGFYFRSSLSGGNADYIFVCDISGGSSKKLLIGEYDELKVLLLNRYYQLGFNVTQFSDSPALEIYDKNVDPTRSKGVIQTNATSGLAINKSMSVGVEILSVNEGWLNVSKFHRKDEEINLTRGDRKTELVTEVYAPSERFNFHLPIVNKNKEVQDPPGPHFSYNRDANVNGVKNSHIEQYYGLKVRGLAGENSSQIVLEVDKARVVLKNSECDIEAGDSIAIQGATVTSRVSPKQETAKVAVDRMLLTLTENSDIKLRTRDPKGHDFSISNTTLEMPPLGISSKGGNKYRGDDTYTKWELENSSEVIFGISESGLVSKQRRKWVDEFTSVPSSHSSLENPGMQIKMLGTSLNKKNSATKFKSSLTYDDENMLIYTAFFSAVSYAWFSGLITDLEDLSNTKSDIRIEIPDIDALGAKVLSRKEGDFRLLYHNASDNDIKAFIENTATFPNQPGKDDVIHWPLIGGKKGSKVTVSIVLAQYNENSNSVEYASSMMQRLFSDGALKPSIGIDIGSSGIIAPSDIGWVNYDQEGSYPKNDPGLWPAYHDEEQSSSLDPSKASWKGFIFSNMPVSIILDKTLGETVSDQAPFLMNFVKGLNEKMYLKYGWTDSSANSFVVGIKEEFKLLPKSWENIVAISINNFGLKVAKNNLGLASGDIIIELPFWEIENGADSHLIIKATCGYDFSSNEFQILTNTNLPKGDSSIIPGFKKVEFKDFDTDLQSISGKIGLTPDKALSEALPFLSSGLEVDLSFKLSKNPEPKLNLNLPIEKETNLFGKFPIKIQGIQISGLMPSGNKSEDEKGVELKFFGRIDLGLVGINSIGLTVTVTEKDSGWSIDVKPDAIDVSLSLGNFKLSGLLAWGNLEDANAAKFPALEKDDIEKGRDRDFYGILSIDTGNFISDNNSSALADDSKGDFRVYARVANKGELTYWVMGLEYNSDLNIGGAELKDPSLIIAKNADFEGNLREKLLSVDGALALKAPSDNGGLYTWLNKWKPSEDINLLIGASCFLNINEYIASSAKKEDQRTSVILTDSGLARIDTTVMIGKTLPIHFAIAIDLIKKQLLAAFQFPKFKMAGFTVNPGKIVIQVSWGPDKLYRLSVGWPELTGEDEFERDWGKSVMVTWDGAWPINTFWGGFLVKYEESAEKKALTIGFAIRAGWTKNWSLDVSVIKGRAGLTLALGGVVIFQFYMKNGKLESPIKLRTISTFDRIYFLSSQQCNSKLELSKAPRAVKAMQASMAIFEEVAPSLKRSIDVSLIAAVFADVEGHFDVKVFGVTLVGAKLEVRARFKMCGNTEDGVTDSRAKCTFKFKVQIGCFSYDASADYTIVLKNGSCGSSRILNPNNLLPN